MESSAAAAGKLKPMEVIMKSARFVCTLGITLAMIGTAHAQAPSGSPIPVTVDNFVRAESDLYMSNMNKEAPLGKLNHRREPARIDDQIVIRLNHDTLYSSAVFDLDAGPVTITMPDARKRFMSLQIISEDADFWKLQYVNTRGHGEAQKMGIRQASAARRTKTNENILGDALAKGVYAHFALHCAIG
jgi:Protein of unknown function (DUF1254)